MAINVALFYFIKIVIFWFVKESVSTDLNYGEIQSRMFWIEKCYSKSSNYNQKVYVGENIEVYAWKYN